MEWLWPVLIIVGLLVIVGIYLWSTYNSLVQLNVRVDEAWSGITVQLKRRADLIPNLIETVRGYAAHEKSVFEGVTRARAETLSATGPAEAGIAEGHLQQALRSLFAVAENYPDLKANENFRDLQAQLEGTENRITVARQRYIQAVQAYNTTVRSFPSNLTAMVFGHKVKQNFTVENEAVISTPPRVDFGN